MWDPLGDKNMELFPGVEHDIQELTHRDNLAKETAKELESCLIDKFEARVAQHPKKPFVIFDDTVYTYEDVDRMACKVANIARSWSLKPRDCVAIMIQNEPSFIWTFYGLQKLGISVSFINHNLRSKLLVHSIQAVECKAFICGSGKPKPVIFPQLKAVAVCCTCRSFADISADDVVYTVLPLYHNTGCFMSLGASLLAGATVVLRKKFSARHFWPDCRKYKVTVVPYIGELLRYLLSLPENELDGTHSVRAVFGAGLRADIWNELIKRFKIPKIVEFYGATECAAFTANYSGKPGAVGRLSPLLHKFDPDNKVLVKFDVATVQPIRSQNGHCIPVKVGEPGLLIAKVPDFLLNRNLYEASLEANEKKLVRDAFVRGDVYINYGDTLVQDEEYFLYFYDRLGDTFRWKGENVSTQEVANAISILPFIEDANVYGVEIPGHEGKAGMASISLKQGEHIGKKELDILYRQIFKELPSYARPLLVRHLPEALVTGTFKNKKVELAQEGFDVDRIEDPIYFLDHQNQTYTALTSQNCVQFLRSKL
ncbi:very long-chain acyl-CoA synthetase [Elysia marginata]|uniref:long-chain-fatty-acid--CoA ligase n=1 Tax=Elysia marginata TaxID=1093978 RepID=A0AAV4JN15_9GAST|nr:very long-chain acyl-CoA synthetase [Elysia marginata]